MSKSSPCSTGVDADLYVAAQDAVREMIDYLVERYDLSREDGHLLSRLAVDLKISEIVDGGHYIVSAVLPEAIFSSRGP
jgi:acetamidase/formamidase